MEAGYLYIKTQPGDPRTLRVLVSSHRPRAVENPGEGSVRYIARFGDVEAGRMHFQNLLCRALVDIDARTYRVSVAEAIAAIESDSLSHTRVWVDPELSSSELSEIGRLLAIRRANARRADRAWYAVGAAFVVLLLMQVLGLI